jgi:hypothetical protein
LIAAFGLFEVLLGVASRRSEVRLMGRNTMMVMALFAIAGVRAEALDWVPVKTSVPKHLASLFDTAFANVGDLKMGAIGFAGASGSLYSPSAVGDAQLLPNKFDISCFRQEAGESNCYVATATLMDESVSLDLSVAAIIQWSRTKVVAEDNTATCVTQRWEFDLVAQRAALYRMGKLGADPKRCGDPSKATFMAVIGAVQWVGR